MAVDLQQGKRANRKTLFVSDREKEVRDGGEEKWSLEEWSTKEEEEAGSCEK